MKRICIFCGSSTGTRADYQLAAVDCAQVLASRGIGIVYGGCDQGLMKVLADSMLEAGGEIIGVMPKDLNVSWLPTVGINSLIEVDSLHSRKRKMAELSDAFIVLPGGAGTVDEMFDAFTWLLLGLHNKPVGILNTLGYFDGLLGFLSHAESQGFIKKAQLEMLFVERDATSLLSRFANFIKPAATLALSPD